MLIGHSPVIPNTTYTIRVSDQTTGINVYEVDMNGEGLGNKLGGITAQELTFTTGDSQYIGFRFREGVTPQTIGTVQLENGSCSNNL